MSNNNQEEAQRKAIVELTHAMDEISEKLASIEKQYADLHMRADLGPYTEADNKTYDELKKEEESLRKQYSELDDKRFFLINGCAKEEAKELQKSTLSWLI